MHSYVVFLFATRGYLAWWHFIMVFLYSTSFSIIHHGSLSNIKILVFGLQREWRNFIIKQGNYTLDTQGIAVVVASTKQTLYLKLFGDFTNKYGTNQEAICIKIMNNHWQEKLYILFKKEGLIKALLKEFYFLGLVLYLLLLGWLPHTQRFSSQLLLRISNIPTFYSLLRTWYLAFLGDSMSYMQSSLLESHSAWDGSQNSLLILFLRQTLSSQNPCLLDEHLLLLKELSLEEVVY